MRDLDPKELTLRVTHFFVSLVTVALGLRFILKLFGANAANGFVEWVYDVTNELLAPFRGIFPTEVLESDYVVEFSTLFAIILYMLFGLFVMAAVEWLVPGKRRK